jgi:hypothetical protein
LHSSLAGAKSKLHYSSKLGYAPDCDPLDNEDISFMTETSAMRTNKASGDKIAAILDPQLVCLFFRVLAFSKRCNYSVLPVEDNHFALQVGNDNFAISLVKIAGQLARAENKVNVLALQRESLQSRIRSVCHHEYGRIGASIDPNPVWTI